MRRHVTGIVVAIVLSSIVVLAKEGQQKGGQDETGEYNVVAGWPGPFAKTRIHSGR